MMANETAIRQSSNEVNARDKRQLYQNNNNLQKTNMNT